MRTTQIASFLGAVTVAAGTWVIAAPPAFAADPCVKDAKSAGLHKRAAKEACGLAVSGDLDSCATEIAKKAKPPVKDDQDKAMEICKSAAAKPDQTDPTNDTDQPKP